MHTTAQYSAVRRQTLFSVNVLDFRKKDEEILSTKFVNNYANTQIGGG